MGMQSGGGERVLCRQQTAPNLGGSSFAQFCGLAWPGLGVLLVSCDHHLMVATAGGSTKTLGRRISSSSTVFFGASSGGRSMLSFQQGGWGFDLVVPEARVWELPDFLSVRPRTGGTAAVFLQFPG